MTNEIVVTLCGAVFWNIGDIPSVPWHTGVNHQAGWPPQENPDVHCLGKHHSEQPSNLSDSLA